MKRSLSFILIILMLLQLSSCFLFEHKHEPEMVAACAATCTEAGNEEHYRCAECGKLFSDAECLNEITSEAVTLEPLGHTWEGATCTEPKTCTECGATEGEALGHLFSGSCDGECNRASCGHTRDSESHLDANDDDVCDACGESISADVPISGGAEFLPPDEF